MQPFPGFGKKWLVGQGFWTAWSRSRQELIFCRIAQGPRGPVQPNQVWVAPYTVDGDSFRVEKPRLWSEQRIAVRGGPANYDLHPDGLRLAVEKAVETDASSVPDRNKVVLILNFFDELRRLVPAGR